MRNLSVLYMTSANLFREVVAAAEVEEVVVGVEGDNEIIGTTVPAMTRLIRQMRSWRNSTTKSSNSQKKRNQTSGEL